MNEQNLIEEYKKKQEEKRLTRIRDSLEMWLARCGIHEKLKEKSLGGQVRELRKIIDNRNLNTVPSTGKASYNENGLPNGETRFIGSRPMDIIVNPLRFERRGRYIEGYEIQLNLYPSVANSKYSTYHLEELGELISTIFTNRSETV